MNTMSAPTHWREYLMEAAGLGVFMVSAAMMTSLLEHPDYKQVISVGESGADPSFAHDNAHLAALDETLRNEPGNVKAAAARDELRQKIADGKKARRELNGIPAHIIQAEAARLTMKRGES